MQVMAAQSKQSRSRSRLPYAIAAILLVPLLAVCSYIAYARFEAKYGSQRGAILGIERLGGKVTFVRNDRGFLTTGNAEGVYFEDRDLTDAEIAELGEHLRKLPRLQGIQVRSSTLTDDGLQHFHDLHELTFLALRRQG